MFRSEPFASSLFSVQYSQRFGTTVLSRTCTCLKLPGGLLRRPSQINLEARRRRRFGFVK